MHIGYQKILSEPTAFWAANSNEQHIPEVVRVNGLAPVTDVSALTFFIPEVYTHNFIRNLQHNHSITLLGTYIPTYESYQYKGVFQAIRNCTKEDMELQQNYVEALTNLVERILGLSGQKVFDSILFQPSYAISFAVTEIFEQTPYKGTGNLVNKKEVNHE